MSDIRDMVTGAKLFTVEEFSEVYGDELRRKHRQELIEELLHDSEDYSFDFCQSWLRSKLEESE